MKRLLAVVVLLLSTALGLAQNQNAVVKRNTYLREGPSSGDKIVILLKAGDELELVEPTATENYLHVRTLDGEEGFAYARNVTVKPAPETIRKDLSTPAG
jgi:uncharacterized protein YgiM (DUF1202 family)